MLISTHQQRQQQANEAKRTATSDEDCVPYKETKKNVNTDVYVCECVCGDCVNASDVRNAREERERERERGGKDSRVVYRAAISRLIR